MLTLSIEAAGEPPRTVGVTDFPCRIGRHRDSGVQLPSWRVARVHAEIHRIERGYRIVDRGSLGGTWVNGERIIEYGPLDDSDEILIAGFRLRVHPAIAARGSGTTGGSVPTRGGGRLAGGSPGARPSGDPSPGDPSPGDPSTVVPSTGDSPAAGAPGGEVPAGDRPPPGGPALALPEPDRLHAEWCRLMHRRLLQTIDLRRKDVRQLTDAQLRAEAARILEEILDSEDRLPRQLDRDALVRDVVDEAVGLGPLERLLADEAVSEIMVNRADEIFVERAGRLERCALAFSGDDAVRAAIDRVVAPLGRRIDESSPMVDARLPDGSRVNAVIPPLAVKGPAITIRRFNRRLFGPDDLVRLGSASQPMLDFLRVCVEQRLNLVVSGGTGSGKTTLLNLLSDLIPDGERVVTIEDAAELRLRHHHLVSLEARPANSEGRGAVSIRELVRNALRMRPDRIVVGECRGGEALDMLQAMNTGHDGSLTTVHANSPRDVISRLEVMVLMAGVEMPVAAIREQVASAIDVIVQQARMADGRRRIVEIVEVSGLEGQRVLMQPLFRFRRTGARDGEILGHYEACGNVPQFYERLRAEGMPLDLSIFEAEGER